MGFAVFGDVLGGELREMPARPREPLTGAFREDPLLRGHVDQSEDDDRLP